MSVRSLPAFPVLLGHTIFMLMIGTADPALVELDHLVRGHLLAFALHVVDPSRRTRWIATSRPRKISSLACTLLRSASRMTWTASSFERRSAANPPHRRPRCCIPSLSTAFEVMKRPPAHADCVVQVSAPAGMIMNSWKSTLLSACAPRSVRSSSAPAVPSRSTAE